MPERKDNFWKRLGSSLTNATLWAAMADSPAAMTASGWSRNPDGTIAQDSQDDVGVKKLRDNLAVLGGAASGITAGGLVGAYGIKPSFRALMNGLDYTIPSHWTTKLAAKLALPYESAQGIGYAADMLVPATGHLTGAVKDIRKKNEAIESGNQALVDYYRRRGVMNLIGTAADFIVPPMMEGAVGLWRKSRNLRNLSNAGVLGKYGNVADNLAMYHSGSGEGWDALNAMKNTNLKIVDELKDGVADFVPGANTIRIPRKSYSYLELGPEYAEALMAHEGTHAIFDSWNLPLRSPVSVIGHGYYVPNASNPLVGSFAPLVKSNRLGAWEASPEEFIAEMGFLRQLTGQNKIYTELSPFYKKRFNKYMSDRFNISKKEASDIMTSISGYYSDGGKLRGLAERLKARKDGAELVNKFKCGGKKYPGGGKIDTGEYPTSSTSAYLRGLSDYVLRRKTPKSFVESEYRPTIGDDGEKYYTRPGLKNEVALNLFGGADYGKGVLGGNYFYRDFDDAYNSISGHPLNRDMRATSNGTLGRYSVTAGMDDKGRYLSFTDKFDHVFIPGKPIHIYDRIYENEVPALYNANDSAINLGDALSRSPLLKNMKSSSENKYPGGGKFFRTNLQNESPLMYQPILPSYPDVPTPMRYEPQPHYGLYEYPSTTGMAENYPVTLPPRVPVTVSRNVSEPAIFEEEPVSDLFSDAARKRGYMAEGGHLFRNGGPEKQNWFTRMMLNSVMNDPYTGAVATASGWARDKEGNVTQTEEAANSEGAKRLRTALAEIAAMPLTDLVVDVAGAAVVGTKTYKSIKLARELNKMLKAGEFDAAVDMAREASKAEPIVKASTTLPAGYPSSSDYSLTRIPSSLPTTEQPANLVSLPNYAGQVEDAIKAGKWGNLRFYRNIDGVPYTTDSGLVRLGRDENALVNVTSDLPFRLHGNYKAAPGAEYLVIDPEALVGKTPLSIEPMDTFFPNVGMDIDPKYVKIITGNKGIIPEIEAKGMEALTSPELQELYSKIGGDFGSEAAAAYRDAVDKYITENLGRPSLSDYAHLEEVTGLKSGTVPLSEQKAYNAAKQASKEIEATYDWMSKMNLDSSKYFRGLSDDIRWPYTHANGRDISAISFSEEPIIGIGGNVFYDTAPHIEAGLMESLGSYPHPNIDRLDSILEYTLDQNGYHYFDPQIGKQGFILPAPIRKDGGKIHIKPENRGKFTALKKRTGHSASWFKAHGTPAQKKMAVFALNSRKWRHGDGGPIDRYSPEQIRAAIAKLKETRK